MKLTIAALAALAALSAPVMAQAPVPPPIPFAITITNRASDCISVDEVKAQIEASATQMQVQGQPGGRGLMFVQGIQQAFADEWRKMLGLPTVAVSVTLVWLQAAVVISEFDAKGCLLTISPMSLAAWEIVANAMKAAVLKEKGASMPRGKPPPGFKDA